MEKINENKDLSLKALIALNRGSQAVRRKEMTTVVSSGLTVSQFAVLEILFHKGDMRISDIIKGILITGGNMTVVTENLIKNGLVEKIKDPEDRRASLLSITEKGRKLMEDIFPAHAENIKNIFSVLTEEEKKSLIKIMLKLRDR